MLGHRIAQPANTRPTGSRDLPPSLRLLLHQGRFLLPFATTLCACERGLVALLFFLKAAIVTPLVSALPWLS